MTEWISGPTILSSIAALCALGAAIWSGVEQNRQLAQIIDKQQESLDFLTGGASFMFHHFIFNDGTPPQARWYTQGDDPVYVVRVSVHNVTAGLERIAQGKTTPSAEEIVRIDAERTLPAGRSSIFSRFAFPQSGQADYVIWLNQRNGEYCQVVGIRQVAGHGVCAYDVFRVKGREKGLPVLEANPLKSYTDDAYPREATSGRREWIDNVEAWKSVVEELTKAPDIG